MARFDLTPKQALQIVAGLSVAQAALLLVVAQITEDTGDKARFLADIVSRNVDRLEEFDLIALADLGMIERTK